MEWLCASGGCAAVKLNENLLEIVLEVHEREEIFFTYVSEVLDDADLYRLSLYLPLRFVGFAMMLALKIVL